MKRKTLTRRRVLCITAALPVAGLTPKARAAAPLARWDGVALGAQSRVLIAGLSDAEAQPVFSAIRDEIARLELIFSLYRPQSVLSRLNDTGKLASPPAELLEVLGLSRNVWYASQGAFDPTVQRLWRSRGAGEETVLIRNSLQNLTFSTDTVTLSDGAELTLNGIAQGYITDRIADMLQAQGLTDLVIDTGEQRALGTRPSGGGWTIGVADPAGSLLTRLTLRDGALATSSPGGTRFSDGQGHIIDARTGRSTALWQTVSIRHDSAAVADALSTAACCLTVPEISEMLARFSGAEVVYRG